MNIKRLAVNFGLVFTILLLIKTFVPFLWNFIGLRAKTIKLPEYTG